ISSFIVTSIPETGIKLLRARPETEKELVHQLDIPRRIELLRRTANAPRVAVQDAPELSSDPLFLQDVALIGHTSIGENVYLILSIILDPPQWTGGWGLALVPNNNKELFEKYLAQAREEILAELRAADGSEHDAAKT